MTTHPLINVFVPAYHPPELLARCLDSLVSQTVPLESITVVDDCSPYDITPLHDKYPNVRFIRNETNLGIGQNLNRCIAYATGEFLTFVHSDDQMAPRWHETWIQWLELHIGFKGLMFSAAAYIDKKGHLCETLQCGQNDWIEQGENSLIRLWQKRLYSLPFSGAILYNRCIFEEIGLFPAAKYPNNSDVFFNLRAACKFPVGYCPQLLFFHRRHIGQSTSQTAIEAAETATAIYEELTTTEPLLMQSPLKWIREPLSVYYLLSLKHRLFGEHEIAKRYAILGNKGYSKGWRGIWLYLFSAKILLDFLILRKLKAQMLNLKAKK